MQNGPSILTQETLKIKFIFNAWKIEVKVVNGYLIIHLAVYKNDMANIRQLITTNIWE